jgi:hypothetical protein
MVSAPVHWGGNCTDLVGVMMCVMYLAQCRAPENVTSSIITPGLSNPGYSIPETQIEVVVFFPVCVFGCVSV